MIYLDLGCHNGESIVDFHEGRYAGINPAGYRSIGFDPLTEFLPQWEEITKKYGTQFINKAAFIHNGDIDFSKYGSDLAGSTVMRDKINWEKGEIKKVECLDIVEYVRGLEPPIVARMDLEGAEYPILQKLIDTDLIKKFSYVGFESHWRKMDGKYKRDEDRILKTLHKLGINHNIFR